VSDADFTRRVTGVGSLVEPVRRDLYRFVAGQTEPVSRDQAAQGLGIARHTAKFHLDRMVADGLLETEFRRLTGRDGPGAGRPAKLYRRSRRALSVSVPERRYELAGQLLAEAVEVSGRDAIPVLEAVRRVAAESGRRLGRGSGVGEPATALGPEAVERATVALAEQGFEPRLDAGTLVLGNCPFHALAEQHQELVCGMNLSLVEGLLEGLACRDLRPVLDPGPGRCCVTTTGRPLD
jgi:predicted ArsR family transcriptional regulator